MNTFAKLAIAAAAVVVVAVVGYQPAARQQAGSEERPRGLAVALAVTDPAAQSVAEPCRRLSPRGRACDRQQARH